MLTTQQYFAAAKAGTLPMHRVIVDNDCVCAREIPENDDDPGKELCGFNGDGPQEVLIAAFEAFGVDAEHA